MYCLYAFFFFFNDTATTEIYTLSLHDALPISCPYAGVAHDERFDVTPYAEALTRHLLRHPLSSTLPRKFKIAFEGCAADHVALGINDLGFKAVSDGIHGGRGFRVTAGGGTAILTTNAGLLHAFLPASEILRSEEH